MINECSFAIVQFLPYDEYFCHKNYYYKIKNQLKQLRQFDNKICKLKETDFCLDSDEYNIAFINFVVKGNLCLCKDSKMKRHLQSYNTQKRNEVY